MKNRKLLIGVIVVVLVLAIPTVWFFGTRNSLISLEENVNSKWSNIETQLQRRSDLIPNLVETVQGYANHEEEVFTEIANARSKLAGSIENGSMDEVAEANSELDSALSRLLVITENYPTLQANQNFTALQDELAGTENRITVARQYYNEAVTSYNIAIRKFPASIVADISEFQPAEYFEADEGANEVPEVSFE